MAVHEIIRRTDGDAADVDQPSPMPQGVSDLAVGAEPEPPLVVAAMLAGVGGDVARPGAEGTPGAMVRARMQPPNPTEPQSFSLRTERRKLLRTTSRWAEVAFRRWRPWLSGCLKRYYADAPVDDLRWILDPTTRLVGAVTGARSNGPR